LGDKAIHNKGRLKISVWQKLWWEGFILSYVVVVTTLHEFVLYLVV
jgi:hypothetical protein